MRQLLAQGWMHNRSGWWSGRFLIKDLHVPWQAGARHFMEHLVDGDAASNTHGWQWTAGTGTGRGAVLPRVQPGQPSRERFDPDGAYIRRWVPELADVEAGRRARTVAVEAGRAARLRRPRSSTTRAEREEALRRYGLTKRRAPEGRRAAPRAVVRGPPRNAMADRRPLGSLSGQRR